MNQDVFNVCQDYSDGRISSTWDTLAEKYGYVSGNALRKQFGRSRKRLKKTGSIEITPQSKKINKVPRVLCLDIEVSPMLVYTFSLANNYISPDHVAFDSRMLAWGAKELNDSEITSDIITSDEATHIDPDDERIVNHLWQYLNGANIIIGHNVKEFDIKYINSRFIAYGLPPLSSFSMIDTLLEARKNFRFSSNKLSFINKILGIKQKQENRGMQLWIDCMDGDKKSLTDMLDYCVGDVMAVEELYYKIRPFISGHPNLGLYMEEKYMVCPNCGSSDVEYNGYYYTSSGKFQSVRCTCCGALSRMRNSETSKEIKKNLLRN